MDRDELRDWIDRYEATWRAAGTDRLEALFAPHAIYSTAPFQEPYRGHAAIAEMWELGREGPDEPFEMTSEVVAVEGDTGVVRLEVRYGEPRNRIYRDLWIVRLDDGGRCTAFEEWPFWPPGSGGGYAPGPSG